jgi:2-hydroxychromene-2-carboxylate isomerase
VRDNAGVRRTPASFYFGAMSPYSWISAERIDTVLPDARWCPLLLFAVFKAHGRTSWGLTDQRERGMAESEERAAQHGLGPIRWPPRWPTSDLLVARSMTFAAMQGALKPLALSAMRLSFLEGADLAERETVLEAGRRAGLDPSRLDESLDAAAIKQALRERTDEALAAGVFGVPTVLIGDRLFWGDDKLAEAAAEHAAGADG